MRLILVNVGAFGFSKKWSGDLTLWKGWRGGSEQGKSKAILVGAQYWPRHLLGFFRFISWPEDLKLEKLPCPLRR